MVSSSGRLLLICIFLSLALFGGIWDRAERYFYGVNPGVCLEDIDVGCYLPQELMPLLEEIAAREQTLPREPYLDKKGNLQPGKPGYTVDIEATLYTVLHAEDNTRVKLVRIETPPRHQDEELKHLNRTLGRFSTRYSSSPGRISNMRVACQAINYTVLWPGETFSFNQTVGPRTIHYGYHPAPIMLDEELVPGIGGGVCQVATTLYNAARLAKLPITERHRHSGPVKYVREGLDAAVAYDYMDLKFKNNLKHPVVIRCYVEGGRVNAVIQGR